MHFIGHLIEQIDHPRTPGKDGIVRLDELKAADTPRPLKRTESYIVGPSRELPLR